MFRRLRQCLCAIACLLPAAAPAWAGPDTYALDPVHTRIAVAVDHAGFSRALGALSGSTGTLVFDPDDWSSARVEVSVPLARLDFGDDDWNRATLARGLLDAGAHPLAHFVSTRIEPLDARRAVVHGVLTLRGVSREIALDAVFNAARRHPLPPFRRTAGFSATATLSRADFGITAWRSLIGDAVELRIEVEATRTRGDADDAETGGDRDADADADIDDDVDLDADADADPGTDAASGKPAGDRPPEPRPDPESSPSPDPEPTP